LAQWTRRYKVNLQNLLKVRIMKKNSLNIGFM
jgi:hypothetical protein